MGIKELRRSKEAEEGSDDRCPQSGCDSDGFPTAKEFNAAIAEANESIDPDNFDDDFELLEDEESEDLEDETLPEMDTIRHNLGV